jgi:cytochrome b subunit of formate dehydrogenase
MSGPRFLRFTKSQRLQHAVLMASFTLLALTGLPQRYAASVVGERVIALLGGIEAVRVLHRVAAVLLMATAIVHLIDVAWSVFGLRQRLSMWPGLGDVRDLWQTLRYNLGQATERPRMGRYTFEEKLEYLSLLWGTGIMVLTGFALWNPIATARALPGQFIPAALAAHSGEALLAVLAVVIWHGYGVHLRHFNRSMFTGTISEEEMREHHPLELEALGAGAAPPALPSPEMRRRRRAVFLPVAILVSALLVAGLYAFVTFEETAIATVPPPSSK